MTQVYKIAHTACVSVGAADGSSSGAKTKKYMLVTKRMNWKSAQNNCAKLHKGSLVVISDAKVQKEVKAYLAQKKVGG